MRYLPWPMLVFEVGSTKLAEMPGVVCVCLSALRYTVCPYPTPTTVSLSSGSCFSVVVVATLSVSWTPTPALTLT